MTPNALKTKVPFPRARVLISLAVIFAAYTVSIQYATNVTKPKASGWYVYQNPNNKPYLVANICLSQDSLHEIQGHDEIRVNHGYLLISEQIVAFGIPDHSLPPTKELHVDLDGEPQTWQVIPNSNNPTCFFFTDPLDVAGEIYRHKHLTIHTQIEMEKMDINFTLTGANPKLFVHKD